MLETVKQYIQDLDTTSFQEFFVHYVLEVQDSNIESEVSSAFRRVSTEIDTLNYVDRLIDTDHEGLVK